jgi:hypothetical protein
MADDSGAVAFVSSDDRLSLRLRTLTEPSWRLLTRLFPPPECASADEEDDSDPPPAPPLDLPPPVRRLLWLPALSAMFAPALLSGLLLAAIAAPVYIRASRQCALTAEALASFPQLNASSVLLDVMFGAIRRGDASDVARIASVFADGNAAFAAVYDASLAVPSWAGLNPGTMRELMSVIVANTTHPWFSRLARVVLSSIVEFTRRQMARIFAPAFQSLVALRCSRPGPFLALACCAHALLLAALFRVEWRLHRGLNALFHFPARPRPPAPRGDDLPATVLLVSYLDTADEIYAISDNCRVLLNQPPRDFIARRMADVFPAAGTVREFTLADRRTRRRFRCATQRCGPLVKALLVHEVQASVNKDQLFLRLAHFVSPDFARAFCENRALDPTTLVLANAFVVLVRLAPHAPAPDLERAFTVVSNCRQNYSSVALLRCDGSAMLFATTKHVPGLLALLFVRDILIGCARTNGAVAAALVDWAGSGRATLNTAREPCVDVAIPTGIDAPAKLFLVPAGTLAVAPDALRMLGRGAPEAVVAPAGRFVAGMRIVPFAEFLAAWPA